MINESSGNLILFTNSFPYGTGESFLTLELEQLSKIFNSIEIIPLVGLGKPRFVPANVIITSPVFDRLTRSKILLKGLLSFVSLGKFWKVFDDSFVSNIGQFLISRAVMAHSRKSIHFKGSLKYFYWGKGSASICIFFRIPDVKVVRLHGFDLYENDERSSNVVPLRSELVKNVDHFIFVSAHGLNYFKKKYHVPGTLFRLGIDCFGENPEIRGEEFVLLSCSSLIGLKRIDLLAEALSKIVSRVKWIHIGDGPERLKVEKLTNKFPSHVSVNLIGHMDHQKVFDFYKNNHIDLFVNVSETEGLPYSMIEAQSFGIPILGTDVGGVSEIVNDDTGYLVQKDINAGDLAVFLDQTISRYDDVVRKRKSSVQHYWKNFNAEKNYENLAVFFKTL